MVVRYSLFGASEGMNVQVAEERFLKGLSNPGEWESAGNYLPDSSMHGLNITRAQLCPAGKPAYWERVDETLGLLEQAARNPELNPVLAERLEDSERAVLYG